MPKIIKRIRAKRDLIEQFAWLGEEAGVETAIRFRNAARQAFTELLRMPGMGVPYPLPGDPTVRRWRIPGFEKYLIFYRPVGQDIEIVRVLHGARDIRRIFSER